MKQRYRAVLETAAGVPVTEVAARYEVPRQSVHARIARYGEGGLADRPRRPDTCPHHSDQHDRARATDRSRPNSPGVSGLCSWITERPGLRPRTMDLYRWLLRKHIEPHLGGVPVSRLSTRMIREWRATLLASGDSVSVAAKAYRLLRAILMTAVEDDKILPRNPCRIRGAGTEDAGERPVLTVTQVFELAEQVGRRPVGNIRKVPSGCRLRPPRRDAHLARDLRHAGRGRAGPMGDGRGRARRLHP